MKNKIHNFGKTLRIKKWIHKNKALEFYHLQTLESHACSYIIFAAAVWNSLLAVNGLVSGVGRILFL